MIDLSGNGHEVVIDGHQQLAGHGHVLVDSKNHPGDEKAEHAEHNDQQNPEDLNAHGDFLFRDGNLADHFFGALN